MHPDDPTTRPATPPPGAVHDLAERAVEFVRRALAITPDYTPETLPVVDHYLGQVPRDQAPTVELVAATVGAYFGEVARKALGGEWELEGDAPSGWRVRLPGDVIFSPVGMAASAVLRAEVEGYDASFEVAPDAQAAAEAALADREVPEDEFYSLSGRLETLTTVVDVVISVRATEPRGDS